jgi:hypothetical protein
MAASPSAPSCVAETRAPFAAGTRTQIVLATCACAGASLFVYAVDPSRHAVYPQCLLYNATGLYCAGCGATRAVYALLHGRLLDALHDNVLFVAALPLILYVAGAHVLKAWRANAWPRVDVDPTRIVWRAGAVFAVLVAFMVVRNLPGAPFDWLRPL